jgi:uncharacterized protein YbbC (DUF1343 family)
VLIFDIQDVGARFYTYASTMAYGMEAAAETGKLFIVLDRPNPINGNDVQGPLLDTALQSFVGMFPIPIRHGLTIGEFAEMIVGEKWLAGNATRRDSSTTRRGMHSNVPLIVVPMEGWKRNMWYDDTSLPWVSPSPNMKTLATAIVYPGTCLFEGTNVSEGRGTAKPFEYIVAPWINGDSLAIKLNEYNLPGAKFEPMQFTPIPDSSSAPNPKYKNQICGGIYIHVVERKTFKPVSSALQILLAIRNMYSDTFQFHSTQFDRLAGNSSIRTAIERNSKTPLEDYFQERPYQRFLRIRKKYLLYE